ncbi:MULTISPECIES: glycosyltransferase family 4 protein [Nocardioides]|uniref:Glycosyltransferase family 4 protein n=1 Tax=Nocardioides vastitatis TaxID=2568655 RepID=A0ABW0ZE99_9ACTN|nr:glycosyltransferase family 4 protein [Nocardioides sp.]
MYLIQHFEDWTATKDFVEETWALPMERVVVSGWLLRIAVDLKLSATLIRNGVDGREFPPGPPVTERRPSVLALVSDQPWKRTDVVAEVYRDLEGSRRDVRLAAFGTCPRPKSLPRGVRYYRDPSRSQLSTLYRNSAIYLCASDHEGFGLPVAEAMASGAAVVSTLNGGVPDFAGDGFNFQKPGDTAGILGEIHRLLDDPVALSKTALDGQVVAAGMSLSRSAAAFVNACMG